jgi:type I restriction enzyme M protein
MAVVLPHGALFRMAAEGKIRAKLLGMDILDAVIGLGPNLFYGTGLAACILVFRQKKPKDLRKKVLIVDASKVFKKGRAQNELLPDQVDRIYQWYAGHKDVAGVARLVPLEEIQQNDWNLNIPRYVEPVVEAETLTVADALANLKTSLDAAYAAEDRLKELLEKARLMQ